MNDKENKTASRSRPPQTIASFLLKTFEILEQPDFKHIICWDKDDEGFVVKNLVGFTSEILPKYFRHNNFSSFVRQLNMYDFHKIKQNNDNFVFKNPLFRKGAHHLLKQIKRKASKKTEYDLDRKIQTTSSHHHESDEKAYSSVKQAKSMTESQISLSAGLFDKSLSLLDSQFTSIEQARERLVLIKKQLDLLSSNSELSLDPKSLDIIYNLKRGFYSCLQTVQNFWKLSRDLTQQKLDSYIRYEESTNQPASDENQQKEQSSKRSPDKAEISAQDNQYNIAGLDSQCMTETLIQNNGELRSPKKGFSLTDQAVQGTKSSMEIGSLQVQ